MLLKDLSPQQKPEFSVPLLDISRTIRRKDFVCKASSVASNQTR